MELLLFFLAPVTEGKERFWGCLLLGIIVAVGVCFWIPGHGLKIGLSIAAITAGTVVGVIWQKMPKR